MINILFAENVEKQRCRLGLIFSFTGIVFLIIYVEKQWCIGV